MIDIQQIDKLDLLNSIELLKGLMNITDIIIILVVAYGAIIGYKKGLTRTVVGTVRTLVSMFGATIVARFIAPTIAPQIVTPIVDGVIKSKLGEISNIPTELVSQIQSTITHAATPVAQSIAFSVLFFISMFIINFVLGLFTKTMRIVNRIPIISTLNRVCGMALGAVVAILICVIALAVLKYFAPDIFGASGYLSPQNLAKTSITSYLIGFIPHI